MSAAKPLDLIATITKAANSDWARPVLYALATPHFIYFSGPWIALPWLAMSLALEAAFLSLRNHVMGGAMKHRALLVVLACTLGWPWLFYAIVLWLHPSLAAQAAAVCALFTSAVVSAFTPQTERRVLLAMLAPPVLLVFAMLALAYADALPLMILPIALCSALGITVVMLSAAEASYQNQVRMRQMRAELKADRDALDRRVRERTAELELANVAANAAIVAKSQFLATMSHELRTPLNAVIGFSEIVMEELGARGMTSTIEDMERIRAAGQRLLTLVTDVLDFAKADSNELALDWGDVDCAMLIREIAEEMRTGARTRGNRIEVSIESTVTPLRADAKRLKQTLAHLLSNAVKFTKDGVICVSADVAADQAGDWLVISVRDTGIGIANADMAQLFQPFGLGDGSSTRNTDGAGLGLAMSHNIARLMGGDLRVESVLGEGSTFTLRLPRRVAAHAIAAA